ncbi:MAG: PA2778 family cysteine peptidase [Gammaproteobacteria bacterium]|nr:PA2778 family cysteine peptidase [Gammaproteobacteria bacterium]
MKTASMCICLLLAVVLLAACAPRPPLPGLQGAALELDTVPFYPQEQYQCGPAALATVLQWNGVGVTPEQLAPTLMIPARKGSLQIELQAQTRAQGRVPFAIRGDLSALQAELAAGHPVLVLQNLAFDWKPVWHYAVVVGIDPAERTVTLRSGRERRHGVGWETFERTWARAEHWGLVVLKPGELPATADVTRVLEAVTPFEQARRWQVAETVYSSAAQRWPRQAVFALGVANSRFARGDLAAAEAAYRDAIAAFPDDPVAYNNLAIVLADLKRWDEAERLVARALEISSERGGPLRDEFLDTQRRIGRRIGSAE